MTKKGTENPKCNLQSTGFPQYMEYHVVLSQQNNPETKNMRLASQGQGLTVWEFH